MAAVRELAHLLHGENRDWSDHHARWALYVRAVAEPEARERLRRAARLDPDQEMVASLVVMMLEHLRPADRDSWVRMLSADVRAFPARRAVELQILEELVADPAGRWTDPETIAEWSNWLQLSVAAAANPQVRAVLAERGRTKRIRRVAREGTDDTDRRGR